MIYGENINRDMSKHEIFRWLDENINKDLNSKLIDPMFFAKYNAQSGFKFILDGVNNISKDSICIGFYSLYPPGKYYVNDGDTSDLILNGLINWDSPVGQTIFFDKWFYFRDIEFFQNLSVVVEIYQVILKNESIKFIKYAWTLLQVFNPKGYTNSGNYQIPLLKYPVNLDLLE